MIHLDIKPSNIVIDECGKNTRLIDFGISRGCCQKVLMTTGAGTKGYHSPEKLAYLDDKHSLPRCQGYNGFKSDAWALTVTLCYMVCR